MRHQKRLKKLGLKKSHRDSLLKNLIGSLVLNGSIKTTESRAKALASRFARLMTHVHKKEPREAIRLMPNYCNLKTASVKILGEIKERTKGKTSGFTRITQIGMRKGDNAKLVQIEII
jgi:large subunit ribosomal protein L17